MEEWMKTGNNYVEDALSDFQRLHLKWDRKTLEIILKDNKYL